MTSIAYVTSTGMTAYAENKAAVQCDQAAAKHRATRDTIMRALRKADPARWTYKALAQQVGMTEAQAKAICLKKP